VQRKDKTFAIRISDSQLRQLKALADDNDLSVSALLRLTARRLLDNPALLKVQPGVDRS
jgi:hypothetical protein